MGERQFDLESSYCFFMVNIIICSSSKYPDRNIARFLALGAFAFVPSLASHPLIKRIELFSYPPRELVTPSAPWTKTRVAGFRVKSMCHNDDGAWLPEYDELARRMAD